MNREVRLEGEVLQNATGRGRRERMAFGRDKERFPSITD